jgi:hypothetical protein
VTSRLRLGVGHAEGAEAAALHVPLCPRRGRPGAIEVVPRALDPELFGIGGSWAPGDTYGTRVSVPRAPTTAPELRYMLRVCALPVGSGEELVLKGIRTGIVIGTLVSDGAGGFYPLDLLVSSPYWSFTDGNVTFAQRWVPGAVNQLDPLPGGAPPMPESSSIDLYGEASGLVCNLRADGVPEDGIHAPYRPPAGGEPPGVMLPGMADVRDGRFIFPSHGVEEDLDIHLVGPGMLVLWASVYQTDPATRVILPAPFVAIAPNPEDRFVGQAAILGADVIYNYVTGGIVGEIGPVQNPAREDRR